MKSVFDPCSPVLVPSSDGSLFPVRRIFCVGRNYGDHAREMGADPTKEPPFFFTKWAETVVRNASLVPYPQATRNFHYEAELVAAIGKAGRNISTDTALEHVWGYACGLDMTRRDLQLAAREQGRPWDTSKNVEASAPLGTIHPVSETGHLAKGAIQLTVNGDVRQRADLSEMIWSVPQIIAFLSQLYRLEAGDLIFTGTPAGVGAVIPGDVLEVTIAGLAPLTVTVGPPASNA